MYVPDNEIEPLKREVFGAGFGCVEGAIEESLLGALREEALARRRQAKRAVGDGAVAYRGYLAGLGPHAEAFLSGQSVAMLLESVFGREFELVVGSSCHTYYEAGDYLGAHCDDGVDCETTVLVYLDVTSPDPDATDTGLRLDVYESLGDRAGRRVRTIKTKAGALVVGRGAQVWHGRPPLRDGEHVALLSACYRAKPTR